MVSILTACLGAQAGSWPKYLVVDLAQLFLRILKGPGCKGGNLRPEGPDASTVIRRSEERALRQGTDAR